MNTAMNAKSQSESNATSNHTRQMSEPQLEELPDLATYVTTYARQRPDVAALWCFGVGFVLGWKLKPW